MAEVYTQVHSLHVYFFYPVGAITDSTYISYTCIIETRMIIVVQQSGTLSFGCADVVYSEILYCLHVYRVPTTISTLETFYNTILHCIIV